MYSRISEKNKFVGRPSWIFSRQVWPPGSSGIKYENQIMNLIAPLWPKASIGTSAKLLAKVRGRRDDARFYQWFEKNFVAHRGGAWRLLDGDRRCDGWLGLLARVRRGSAVGLLSPCP